MIFSSPRSYLSLAGGAVSPSTVASASWTGSVELSSGVLYTEIFTLEDPALIERMISGMLAYWLLLALTDDTQIIR